jgi:hypothetical protein
VISSAVRWGAAAVALGTAAALAAGPAAANPATGSGAPGWQISSIVNIHKYRNLIGLAATGPNDAWAFGDGRRWRPTVVHWNGATWTFRLLPGANARPQDVSSTGRRNVWASGQKCYGGPPSPPGQSGYVDRWNGSKWATLKIKNLPIFCGANYLVTTGPRNGWLFGGNQAMHFSWPHWRVVALGNVGQVFAAAAATAKSVWAFAAGGPRHKAEALRWNGHAWRNVPLPDLHLAKGVKLLPVAANAAGPSDVWLAGQTSAQPAHLVLLQWDGTAWQQVVVPASVPPAQVAGLTGDGAGGVWILSYDADSGAYSFRHYAGGQWTAQAVPTTGLPGVIPTDVTFNIYAIGLIPGTTSVWATGDASYSDSGDVSHQYTVFFKYGT